MHLKVLQIHFQLFILFLLPFLQCSSFSFHPFTIYMSCGDCPCFPLYALAVWFPALPQGQSPFTCGYATHLHSHWNLLKYLRLRLCRAELLASLLLAALPWAHRPPGLLPVLQSSGQRDAQGRKWPQSQFSQPSVTETPHDFSHVLPSLSSQCWLLP